MVKMCSGIIIQVILFLHLLVIFGCACRENLRAEKYSETRMLMGTVVHLDACRGEQDTHTMESAYKDVWERLEDIAWRMNVFDGRSDVAKINNSNLEPVSIGADTYQVLKASIYFSRATGGAFDVTVWPLIKLWRDGEKNNVLPSREGIKAVQTAVGPANIQLLANNRVKLLNGETKIDLGGIAKGYAIDEAARIFREHGIMNFFVDAGGDIYAGGRNCSGRPWRVGIRDPRDPSGIIDVVGVVDGAVTTSGNYEQYYEIQNERWSHIMNPVTGYPQRGVISATVIAPGAMEADALATALCVLGRGAGTKLIDALGEHHASLVIDGQESGRAGKSASRGYKKFRLRK